MEEEDSKFHTSLTLHEFLYPALNSVGLNLSAEKFVQGLKLTCSPRNSIWFMPGYLYIVSVFYCKIT